MSVWNFPTSSNTPGRGYADPGLATFGGSQLTSLARETCQNSLDARLDLSRPVRMEFERYQIATTDFPGLDEYLSTLEGSLHYWTKERSEKAHAFLENAVRVAHGRKLTVLRISDYNTTGLSDPYAERFGGWNILTKLDGGATKGGDSAGSYGIGKNAPFTASALHLVFYRTRTEKAENAAQGVARVPAYPMDESQEVSTQIAGIGYYGEPEHTRPVESIPVLDALNQRMETGTDVFVFGFKDERGWEGSVIGEILESFLPAIFDNRLEVRVQGEAISRATLGSVVEKYRTKAKNARDYYKVLTEPERVKDYTTDFEGMGRLHLQLIADPSEKLNRKVLVVRSTGMKILAIDRISSSIMFTGILVLEGTGLNLFFREMESPAHDKWDPGRHSDPKRAAKLARELRRWVTERVYEASSFMNSESMEVTGLSQYLQDVDASPKEATPQNTQIGSKAPEVSERPVSQDRPGAAEREPNPDAEEAPVLQNRPGKSAKKPKDGAAADSQGEKEGRPGRHPGRRKERELPLRKARVIRGGSGSYRLILETARPIPVGHITVHTIGENGSRSWPLEILAVSSGDLECRGRGREIEFKDLVAFQRIALDFQIPDSEEYVMGVALYEDR